MKTHLVQLIFTTPTRKAPSLFIMEKDDGFCKKLLRSHILEPTVAGIVAFAAVARYLRRRQKLGLAVADDESNFIMPKLDRTQSGRIVRLEPFSHYAARQLGFKDASECPNLCKLANDYVKNSKGGEDHQDIYGFFANNLNDNDEAVNADLLYVKLVEELDCCVLSYFAFHWNHASFLISQVLSVDDEKKTKLKNFVMAATRKSRFEKVSKKLKVTRVISTLVEEMKAIGGPQCTEVMVPAAHSERSPVLLLMGGGMGAGKSTVLKDILKETFWSEANAVVVEADAFKETDVIYRALSLNGHHHDMLQTAELVHQSSTDAASSLLVTALNEGRDVIMDGTLAWVPFVEQTIAMARNVHSCRYRMGVGYKAADDGTVTEDYWEQVEDSEEEMDTKRKPYRIELVGVVCDAYLAVIRGIRRAVQVKRAVRVTSQLQSHKSFAAAFPRYCELVDNARLYSTNAIRGLPTLIARKDGDSKLLVDPEEIKCLTTVSNLNHKAESIYELYEKNPNPILDPGSVWKDTVLSPSRAALQEELKATIEKIEAKASSPLPIR